MSDRELMLRAIEALEAYRSRIVLPWRMTKDDALLDELRKAAACGTNDNPKTKPVCTVCGVDDVRCDAYAIWSVPNQAWELLTTFDNTDCEKCGGECSVTYVAA